MFLSSEELDNGIFYPETESLSRLSYSRKRWGVKLCKPFIEIGDHNNMRN